MINEGELLINGYYSDAESYIKCAGIEAGDYTLKIDTSSIRNLEEEWYNELSLRIAEETVKRLNRIYIPEQEEDPKYTPNYRLGFL